MKNCTYAQSSYDVRGSPRTFLHACLPRRDCSVPSSVDAMSFSLSKPRPLSIHDWAVFSKTYNLHCILNESESKQGEYCFLPQLLLMILVPDKPTIYPPVKHCFPIPLQFSRRLSLRCTSWLWLWCTLLQTPPTTLTRCSLVRQHTDVRDLHRANL